MDYTLDGETPFIMETRTVCVSCSSKGTNRFHISRAIVVHSD